MKRKVKKMCTGLVMPMAFVIATVGTVYGMTQYGHYDISTITETGIRAWAYKLLRWVDLQDGKREEMLRLH